MNARRPRVALVAPPDTYRTGAYIAAASALGLEAVVASQARFGLVPGMLRGIHLDLDAPGAAEDLHRQLRGRGVVGVVATDDRTVELASAVAQRLGLRHNAVASVRAARRKDLARQALRDAGVPVPPFRTLDLTRPLADQLAGVPYPCVVKPLALSGSRGVIRADDAGALLSACERIAAILAAVADPEERNRVLVEGFLPGFEVAVEGMLEHGELRVLALFDKPDPLDGPFFEETYYVTPSRLPAQVQGLVGRRVAEACAAYGLREGPVHAELRVHEGEAWILEVAARTIGGECGRLLRFGAGHVLEELVLAHAAGIPLASPAMDGGAGVLMIPIPRAGILRRVEGVLEALRVPYVEDVTIDIREGYLLTPLPEGSSYLGFIFARAPSAALAERALRQAHGCLKVVTAPLLGWQTGTSG